MFNFLFSSLYNAHCLVECNFVWQSISIISIKNILHKDVPGNTLVGTLDSASVRGGQSGHTSFSSDNNIHLSANCSSHQLHFLVLVYT